VSWPHVGARRVFRLEVELRLFRGEARQAAALTLRSGQTPPVGAAGELAISDSESAREGNNFLVGMVAGSRCLRSCL
jgi:hypothetical protein